MELLVRVHRFSKVWHVLALGNRIKIIKVSAEIYFDDFFWSNPTNFTAHNTNNNRIYFSFLTRRSSVFFYAISFYSMILTLSETFSHRRHDEFHQRFVRQPYEWCLQKIWINDLNRFNVFFECWRFLAPNLCLSCRVVSFANFLGTDCA